MTSFDLNVQVQIKSRLAEETLLSLAFLAHAITLAPWKRCADV